jgi:hypothetical protein
MDWMCVNRLLSRSSRRLNRIIFPPLQKLAEIFVRSNPILWRLRQDWRRCLYSRLTLEDANRLRFYSEFIQADSLVFDVGANLGNRTKIFLRLGARVVAFEPQAACAEYLLQMLSMNEKFRLVRKALGLSQPIDALSIEVVPEYLDNTLHCLQWLDSLAKYEFQFSSENRCSSHSLNGFRAPQLRLWLKSLPPACFGDLYARLAKELVPECSPLQQARIHEPG